MPLALKSGLPWAPARVGSGRPTSRQGTPVAVAQGILQQPTTMLRVQALSTLLAVLLLSSLAQGQLSRQWLAEYDGPLSGGDYVQDVVVDSAGNTYAAGFRTDRLPSGTVAAHFMTLKHDAQGSLVWDQTFHTGLETLGSTAHAVALAPNGDVVVGGGTNSGNDWTIVRYDSLGNELWSYTQMITPVGFGGLSNVFDLEVDSAGNAYLVGQLDCCGSDAEWLLLKVTVSGAFAWARTESHGGAGANVEAIELDPIDSSIYAVGTVNVGQQDTQAALKKIGADGVLEWERDFGAGGQATFDSGVDLALDDARNVLVLGSLWSTTPSANLDALVVKVDADGNELWQTSWNGTASRNESPWAIAVDRTGAAVVTGQTDTSNVDDRDAFVLVVGSDGTTRWAVQHGRTGDHLHDDPRSVVVDDAGRVTIAGQARPDPSTYFPFLAQFAADGVLEFEDLGFGPLGQSGHVFALASRPDGRVWAAGAAPLDGSSTDLILAHYAPEFVEAYCVSATNSVGTEARMDAMGSTSVSANDFTLITAGALPNGFGLYFHGPNRIQIPFGDGFRCVGGQARRLPVVQADGSGAASFAPDLSLAPGIDAGVTRNFQFWYRDPMGANGFNLSDALAVTFLE